MSLPDGFVQLTDAYIDPAFLRNFDRIKNVVAKHGFDSEEFRWAVLEPPVSDHPFDGTAVTHCPRGHKGKQLVLDPEVAQGRACVRRKCRVSNCQSEWLEPLDV